MSISWQTVSVFISSTFNDMHAERDYLVKRVFPELREWCEKRKLRLVDIDLRWGVTEEDATKHKNVVKVCLDRIDECRPFFLCFLGQRRGWVPEKRDVSTETCDTYNDLKGFLGNASVTELEILHAAINPLNYQERAKYSFFYLRDDSYLKDLPDNPPLIRKTYTNDGIKDPKERELADKELKIWRDKKIPETRRPIHHYSATWDEKASTPELNLPLQCPSSNLNNQNQWRSLWNVEAGIEVSGLDIEKNPDLAERAHEFNNILSKGRLGDFISDRIPLSEIIIHDLKKAIEERYPDHHEIREESDLQKELDQQEQFLHLNSEGFIKRTGDFDQLDAYADGNSRNLFVLTAPGGMGKTMLLANWINHYQSKDIGKDTTLFYRLIGASDRSTTVDSVLRYLLREMKENAALFDDEIPADPDKLRDAWPKILQKIGGRKKTIIIIDAMNQLESGLKDLRWIPWQMPAGIKTIISFKRDGEDAEKLYKQLAGSNSVTLAEVKPFTNAENQKALITAFLSQYLKELDKARIAELIATPGAINPLFLKIVLTELRVFGAFTNLGVKICHDFGTTPVSAFRAMLNRLENDPSYSPVESRVAVPLLFGLLSHTRHGLSEDELISLFLQELKREYNLETREGLNDTIRLFLRQVRPFLAVREGRHDFFYESFRLAAIERYEGSDKNQFQRESTEWHLSLAEYFEQLPSWVSREKNIPTLRRTSELPYHLAWAGKSDHLANLILAYELLETIVFGMGPYVAIEDISLVLSPPVLTKNKDTPKKYNGLQLIQDAIRLSAHVFLQKPKQLPSHLVGRLLGFENPVIRKFVDLLNRFDRYLWLRPITPSLTPPGGPLLRTLTGHTDRVTAVAVTPDGCRVISGSEDFTLKIWDLESGWVLASFTGHTGSVTAVVVMPDGRRVISGSGDSTLKIWDMETGRELCTLIGHTGWVNTVAVTPDGGKAVSGSRDTTLKVWDVETGRELRTLIGHTGPVNTVAVTPDGQRVVSVGDTTLKIWDLKTGRELRTLINHTSVVKALAVTLDGRRAISGLWDLYGSTDNTLKTWNLESGQKLATFAGHAGGVSSVAITPDGRRAISGSGDNTLKIWDMETGRELCTLTGHSSWITAVAITPDGRRAISGSRDTTLKVWDLESNRKLAIHAGNADSATAVAITPDGSRAISGSRDYSIKVWVLKSGRKLETFLGHYNTITALAVTRDGRRVVSGSDDNTLKVWDLKSGLLGSLNQLLLKRLNVVTLVGHKNSVKTVALTPDDRQAVSGSYDKTLKVWSLTTGKCTQTLTGHNNTVTALAVTPDGRQTVSGSRDTTLKIWDLESGQELRTLTGHNNTVTAVAITPDGRWAISGSDDQTLKIWDLKSGQELRTLTSYKGWVRSGEVTAVAVVPGGRHAVSGSRDETLKIWDLETGTIIAEFYGEGAILNCIYTDALGSIIAGDESGRIYILRLEIRTPDSSVKNTLERDGPESKIKALLDRIRALLYHFT